MPLEMVVTRICVAAAQALVWLLAGVQTHMDLKVSSLREPTMTNETREGPLASVGAQMQRKARWVNESFLAELAHMRTGKKS